MKRKCRWPACDPETDVGQCLGKHVKGMSKDAETGGQSGASQPALVAAGLDKEDCTLAYHDTMGILRFVNITQVVWGSTLLQKIGAVEGVMHPVLNLYMRGRAIHHRRRYTYMGLMEYGPLRAVLDGAPAPPDVGPTPALLSVPVPHALFSPAPPNTGSGRTSTDPCECGR